MVSGVCGSAARRFLRFRGACHPAPLYTNNKLTPAEGFTIPGDHLKKYDILPISVGTEVSQFLKRSSYALESAPPQRTHQLDKFRNC